MPSYWILDANRVPLRVSMLTWARWFEKTENRRVAFTEIAPGVEVSTVFLGLDHNFSGRGAPVLFETMGFIGGEGVACEQHATWAEAQLAHNRMVDQVRKRASKIASLI